MKRQTIVSRGPDGAALATVPLGPKAKLYCIMDSQSWDWLLNQGYSGKLNYLVGPNAKKYVTLGDTKRNKTLMVARLLVGAKENQRVKYVDGDTLNLRKQNILVIDSKR